MDENGNYHHPRHATSDELLEEFQYFGVTVTDADGAFVFRTQQPPYYDQRPSHLHYKVKLDDTTLLTSQIYFPENREDVLRDYVYRSNGDESLFVEEIQAASESGGPRIVNIQVVLGVGELSPTPELTEGPYYPVIDFSAYNNDLLDADTEQERLTFLDLPLASETVEIEFTLLNLNTASDDEIRTFANIGPNPISERRLIREFREYRPYISISQYRREIGKHVSDEQVAAYEAYLYVLIDINRSDAATLQQIPGLSAALAEELIATRPFADQAAFLAALAANGSLTGEQLALAAYYLEN